MSFEYKSILTKRPPLNLFEVKRSSLSANNEYQTIYCARNFIIPQSGFTQERKVETATIITSLIVSNTSDNTVYATVAIKGLKETVDDVDVRNDFIIIKDVPIEPSDFASISLDRQVMKSSAERIDESAELTSELRMKLGEELMIKITSGSVDVHFSYIVNQREEFTEENQ